MSCERHSCDVQVQEQLQLQAQVQEQVQVSGCNRTCHYFTLIQCRLLACTMCVQQRRKRGGL